MAAVAKIAALLLLVAVIGYTQSASCTGRCGDTPSSGQSCQCNTVCSRYGDCCSDYDSVCNGGSVGSCTGRCGDNPSSSHSCQCNTVCSRYGDCCSDYTSVCNGGSGGSDEGGSSGGGSDEGGSSGGGSSGGGSGEITDADLLAIGDRLWAADSTRYSSSELTLDVNGQRLFQMVDEAKFSHPSYSLFIALLDNYNPTNGQLEPPLTNGEQAETDAFLDHILSSNVMKIVENMLTEGGNIQSGTMRTVLNSLWFSFYGRSSSMNFADSSGFEHVFVGEQKSSKVNGFHSWVQMYLLEKDGRLVYEGYNAMSSPSLMDNRLRWDGLPKERASMFVGTSPDFDMALYTLCMVARPGRTCKISFAGQDVSFQTYDVSHVSGLQIASAFPMVR